MPRRNSVYWAKSEQPAKRKNIWADKPVEQGSGAAQAATVSIDFDDDSRHSDDRHRADLA
jgi:hypothetical protein